MRNVTRRGRPPLALTVPATLGVLLLAVPLLGVLVRAPWSTLADRLGSPAVTEALLLSLLVSGEALLLSLLLGVPLAWLLARVDFPGRTVVRTLVMLPMVLPPTVAGVALLQGFGRQGLVPTRLPFSTAGAVLAATFVALPFLVVSLEGALTALPSRYEETAASLGASPLRVFGTVTLPMVLPGLLAGAALTWARALGEFGATVTFAGNLPGTTQTLPLQVYLLLQHDPAGATAVSLLLLAVATAVLVALRGRWLPSGGDTRATAPVDARRAAASPDGARPAPGRAGPDAPERGYGSPRRRAASARPPAPHPAPARTGPLRTTVTGAVDAVLAAPAGGTVAVLGPNGAGKTTLLRALLGLTPRATAAALTVGGRDLATLPPHRRGIAWVPQDGALFPHLTAVANTAYGLRVQGVPRGVARAAAREWLDRLGVGALAHRRPGQLSGGQAQRVALARALACRPRLLLLDEPLSALDQTTRRQVRQTLRGHLASFPGVCLLVTHDPAEVAELADQVLVLADGRTVQQGTPAEVAASPASPWVARLFQRGPD